MKESRTHSITARRLKEIVTLRRSKGRRSLRQTLIEGPRLLHSAVLADAPILEVLVDDPSSLESKTLQTLEAKGTPVHAVGRATIEKISTVRVSQGVIGVVRLPPDERLELTGVRTVLVLDNVQDPGNVGALIRSAAWFGVGAVLLGAGTADPWNPKVLRAAMGGTWGTMLVRTSDLQAEVSGLKASGCEIVVLTTSGEPISGWQPSSRFALVVGSEAHGVGKEIEAVADRRLSIGYRSDGAVESLNASVAGAIAVYHAMHGAPETGAEGMH